MQPPRFAARSVGAPTRANRKALLGAQAAVALGVESLEIEGSDSLDNPGAVFKQGATPGTFQTDGDQNMSSTLLHEQAKKPPGPPR